MNELTIDDLLNIVKKGLSFSVYSTKGYHYLKVRIENNSYVYQYTDNDFTSILKDFYSFEELSYFCLNQFNDMIFDEKTLDMWRN